MRNGLSSAEAAPDGRPALALVVDPPAVDVLDRPPRDPREELLGRADWTAIAAVGALEAAVVLGTLGWALPRHGLEHARALAFTTLVFSDPMRVFSARDPARTFWHARPLSSLKLLGVVAVSAGAELGILQFAALPSPS